MIRWKRPHCAQKSIFHLNLPQISFHWWKDLKDNVSYSYNSFSRYDFTENDHSRTKISQIKKKKQKYQFFGGLMSTTRNYVNSEEGNAWKPSHILSTFIERTDFCRSTRSSKCQNLSRNHLDQIWQTMFLFWKIIRLEKSLSHLYPHILVHSHTYSHFLSIFISFSGFFFYKVIERHHSLR